MQHTNRNSRLAVYEDTVNNAGVLNGVIDEGEVGYDDVPEKAKFIRSYKKAEACLRTNYYGVKQVTQELIPLLELSDSPRIVNVSSNMGQLQGMLRGLTEEKVDAVVKEFLEDVKEGLVKSKGWPSTYTGYTVSKAALNAYTRVLAKMYPRISINAVGPGWVKTDLSNNQGNFTAEEVKCERVNNAGVTGVNMNAETFPTMFLKSGKVLGVANKVVLQTYEAAEGCLQRNYYGAKRLTQALIPLLMLSSSSRIVNISSKLGQLKDVSNEWAKGVLSDADGLTEERKDEVVNCFLKDVREDLLEAKSWPVNLSAYMVSKAALNAYTRILATLSA
ncbi:hypothetical protein RJ639_010031 [Escallonia herrerae]|uniref:Uncharacterized protein n=1 Tax=Escallonia herrerae TaxID=1293975 RepID=A0AA89AR74_9ASTE|nr:hypothetical protein RJ639_010031 [Escallonia herrerae]